MRCEDFSFLDHVAVLRMCAEGFHCRISRSCHEKQAHLESFLVKTFPHPHLVLKWKIVFADRNLLEHFTYKHFLFVCELVIGKKIVNFQKGIEVKNCLQPVICIFSTYLNTSHDSRCREVVNWVLEASLRELVHERGRAFKYFNRNLC